MYVYRAVMVAAKPFECSERLELMFSKLLYANVVRDGVRMSIKNAYVLEYAVSAEQVRTLSAQ